MVTTTRSQHIATQVAVPQDKAVPPQYASAGPTSTVKSEVDRLVDGRFRVARLQRFVADASRREMVVPSAPMSANAVRSGAGTSGIYTVVEPPDLDLYRSYIPDPLRMPATPEVALALVDFNSGNPAIRYPEGWVLVKATRPDNGADLWVVASMPVAAPRRSITELVTRVVPWTTVSTSPGATPCPASRVAMPSSTAVEGSAGVVNCLWIAMAWLPSSNSAKSVKVPPMSTPMR